MQLERRDPERDGPLNEAGMRRKLEDRGYLVHEYVYPAGTFFPDYEHGVDKIDGVLSGRFRMSMGGNSVVLEAGDLLIVPRHTLHSAEVVGNEPVVSLDAVRIRQPPSRIPIAFYTFSRRSFGSTIPLVRRRWRASRRRSFNHAR